MGKTPIRVIAFTAFALFTALPAFPQGGPGGGRTPVVIQSATAGEIKWLKFMREEEKLARDVYRFLYERWNFSVFERIGNREQRHFANVGALLIRYNVPDPASNAPGVFADERLAVLYAELTAKGGASLRDAIEVGIIIEKQDIADLETALQTGKVDIKRVYTNLMTASFNHLDAFETSLCLRFSIQCRRDAGNG